MQASDPIIDELHAIRDAIAAAAQSYLGMLDIDHPSDSPQAVALKALEDLL